MHYDLLVVSSFCSGSLRASVSISTNGRELEEELAASIVRKLDLPVGLRESIRTVRLVLRRPIPWFVALRSTRLGIAARDLHARLLGPYWAPAGFPSHHDQQGGFTRKRSVGLVSLPETRAHYRPNWTPTVQERSEVLMERAGKGLSFPGPSYLRRTQSGKRRLTR